MPMHSGHFVLIVWVWRLFKRQTGEIMDGYDAAVVLLLVEKLLSLELFGRWRSVSLPGVKIR